jgi:hypothetical protein
MPIEDTSVIRAVGRAYLLGVGTSAVLLWVWLLAGTTVILRGYRRGSTQNSMSLVAAGYALLGYIGYLFVLDPITLRFMKSAAIVEPFVLHPWWVRIGIPSISIVAWFLILGVARRKKTSGVPPESNPEVPH